MRANRDVFSELIFSVDVCRCNGHRSRNEPLGSKKNFTREGADAVRKRIVGEDDDEKSEEKKFFATIVELMCILPIPLGVEDRYR